MSWYHAWMDDGELPEHGFRVEARDPDDAAELAAEEYYGNRDGWEGTWPATFFVRDEGGDVTRWAVELDFSPSFRASEAPADKPAETKG